MLAGSEAAFPLPVEVNVAVSAGICNGETALLYLASAAFAVTILECVDQDLLYLVS